MAKLGRSSRRGITAYDYVSDLYDEADWVGGVKSTRVTGGTGVWLTLTTNATLGDVLLIDTANDASVIQGNAANSALFAGILIASLNIAGEYDFVNNVALNTKVYPQAFGATARVFVQLTGVALVVVSGTANRGDIVTTSATAGQVQANNSPGTGQLVGRALQASAGAGSSILILLR